MVAVVACAKSRAGWRHECQPTVKSIHYPWYGIFPWGRGGTGSQGAAAAIYRGGPWRGGRRADAVAVGGAHPDLCVVLTTCRWPAVQEADGGDRRSQHKHKHDRDGNRGRGGRGAVVTFTPGGGGCRWRAVAAVPEFAGARRGRRRRPRSGCRVGQRGSCGRLAWACLSRGGDYGGALNALDAGEVIRAVRQFLHEHHPARAVVLEPQSFDQLRRVAASPAGIDLPRAECLEVGHFDDTVAVHVEG